MGRKESAPREEKSKGEDVVETRRTRVVLTEDSVKYTQSMDFPYSVPGHDDAWSFSGFKKRFRVDLVRQTADALEFDVVGVDASIANAFRRIMLSEVPTMAIEHVYIMNNTSIMQDEVLAHRLGLIPIRADPNDFEYKKPDGAPTDANTLVFELKVKCSQGSKKKAAGKTATTPTHEAPTTLSVLSSHLRWIPQGAQAERLKDRPVAALHDNILVMKLRPGQELDIQMHCEKGIGKTHAKWSPVGTASYRLLPEIILKQRVVGDAARRLQKCFSEGVIGLRQGDDGEEEAYVANARLDTMSREVFRHEDLAPLVELRRVRDHFIFSVESIGALPPERIFLDAVRVLSDKCVAVLRCLDSA